jgi:signal transduction histidine kinase
MTRLGMTTFLAITHVGAAVIAYLVGVPAGLEAAELFRGLGLAAVIGIVWALVITFTVLRDLGLAEAALARLAAGQSIAPLPTKYREPMRFLMEQVNALAERQREITSMRGLLSGQVGEAAAQEERNRLARDLHDSIKQQIFSINISAAAAQARWETDPAGAQAALADVRRSAQEAMVEMRAMLQQLAPAPLEKVGLAQALRDQAEALAFRSGAQVDATISDLPHDDRLPPGAQEAIFRVAQEALANIARHARASTVALRLRADDSAVWLEIDDDGQGFDPSAAAGGMGMTNMRARAESVGGALALDSAVGNGAHLRLNIPLLQIDTVDEEANAMEARREQELKRAILPPFLAGIGGGVAVLLATFFVLVGDETFAAIGQPVFAALTILSLMVALYGALRSRAQATALTVVAGDDKATWSNYRYYVGSAVLVFFLFVFLFAPEILLQGGVDPMRALTFAAVALVGVVVSMVYTYRMYDRHLRLLSPAKLREAIGKNYADSVWNRWSWIWSVPMFLNLLIDFPPPFPPQAGDWLGLALPMLGVVFLVWGVWYMRYHQRWRRELDADKA